VRISQAPQTFQPITITMQTREEADLFISIIDKLDATKNNAGPTPIITHAELSIVTEISNLFTDLIGLR